MVICRYFQQGNCRYGTSCRNEHVYGNQYTYRNTNQNKPPAAPNQNDTAFWIRSINTDMTAAEQGKQWLLSSYGPFKGKSNFPSFEDHSFEEVRWSIYKAQKSGDVNQINNVAQTYSRLAQEAKQKFKSFQTPTRELLDIIKSIYLTPDTSNSPTNVFAQTTGSIFSQPPAQNTNPTPNVFGGQFPQQQQQPTNIFGSAPQQNQQVLMQQNAFGASNSPLASNQSIFGAKPATSPTNTSVFNQGSIFNANQQPQQPQQPFVSTSNVFNAQPTVFATQTQPQSSNVFNTAATPSNTFPKTENRSIFSTQQPQYTGTSIFNQTPQNTFNQPNAFSQPQNVFAQSQNTPFGTTNTFSQTQANTFNSQQQPTNTMETTLGSVFGKVQTTTPTNNIFNTPQTSTTNAFGQQTANIFGQQQPSTTQSIFTQNAAPVQSNTSIFGSVQVQKPVSGEVKTNIFATRDSTAAPVTQNVGDSDVYSKMDDLTEEELNAFNSDSFEFGLIPELPPPLSLCQ